MTISRLAASLASVTNEVTVAAAALNFDFSLVKIEAPEEFKLVGGGLSTNRRRDAETGKAHVTAKKLGALFDKVLPPIPNLIKAYGVRASEISSSPAANPKPSRHDGAFAMQVGADGTTVWAAATSGHGAIAVHLLACLLARIWTGPEATSLWTEIVEKRRHDIAADFESGKEVDFSTLSVARQEFSRTQLAEWDASARGWLRAADIAKASETKQLMLILKNIDICIDRGSDAYEGIIRVWKKALDAMECLVRGIPQSVTDGSVPAAMWAWHLYPDLIVLGASSGDVGFNDSLIPRGGCLTFGLQIEDPTKRQDGIYWSLALANLRYYGEPIVSRRAIVPDGSRMTFEDLAQVAFGSLIGQWSGYAENIFGVAEIFLAIWDAISHTALLDIGSDAFEDEQQLAKSFLTLESNWFRILVDAARPLVEAEGVEQKTSEQLVKLGQRRGKHFLRTKLRAFFGLTDLSTLLAISKSADARVNLLRDIAKRLSMNKSMSSVPCIIRYSHGPEGAFEYASALPEQHSSMKRKHGGLPLSSSKSKRWISSKMFESLADAPRNTIKFTNVQNWTSRCADVVGMGEEVLDREKAGIRSESLEKLQYGSPASTYTLFLGDPDTAALFVPQSDYIFCKGKYSHLLSKFPTVHQATEILRSTSVRIPRLISLLAGEYHYIDAKRVDLGLHWSHVTSLKAFSSAARVYKLLPRASISPNIISRPFYRARWFEDGSTGDDLQVLTAFQGKLLSRAQSFSCIAMLESGIHDIQPSALEQVMALSSSDSIYATASLLCDPLETPRDDEVRRIAGNVGRAGLAMLFAPENVRLCKRDETRWRMVNHENFDGTPEDNYRGTSLHLSFTGFERSLDTSNTGAQDVDVYLLETRLSLHHEGTWLADLNILQSLQSPSISRLSYPKQCIHGSSKIPTWSITAVDNWDEFFDHPADTCIVRAYRNWIARLAFACICHQIGQRAIILPENVCWECYANLSGVHPRKSIELWKDGTLDCPTYIW